jgi:hypothetical protein
MPMGKRTCVVCSEPVITKFGFRLWLTRNGLDFHPRCLRTVRKDEKRRQALIAAR